MDIREYSADLVRQLSRSFGTEAGSIAMDMAADLPQVRMEVCLDLGFVLAELVSNACKHALLADTGARLLVRLGLDGRDLLLAVEDGGPGFPEDFNPAACQSLGYKIVMSIVRKYGGAVDISSGAGARVAVRFPLDGAAGAPPWSAAPARRQGR